MSRSFKKAFTTITKKLRFGGNKAARHKVKQTLNKIDPKDGDGLTLLDIEADTREMGLEGPGTKCGIEFESLKEFSDVESEEEQRKQLEEDRRK